MWNPAIGYDDCARDGHRLHAEPHQQKPALGGAVNDTTSSSDTVAPPAPMKCSPGTYSESGSRSR